jgi:hypothetical protein
MRQGVLEELIRQGCFSMKARVGGDDLLVWK